MKKRIQLVNLPFYTQRMTAENWQEEGFPSLAEAESWSGRGCGIASLRMVLDGFGCVCGRQGEMISKGLAAGAYKEGVGWIHGKLAEMAGNYGIFGEAKRGKNLADLQKDLENGFVCIASVTPYFRFGQQKPDGSFYGKGGHLVLCMAVKQKGERQPIFCFTIPPCMRNITCPIGQLPPRSWNLLFPAIISVFEKLALYGRQQRQTPLS